MRLRDIVESLLVGDDHTITVHLPMTGTAAAVRRGKWYEDQVMDAMDREIDTLRYCLGDWDITLTAKEEEDGHEDGNGK